MHVQGMLVTVPLLFIFQWSDLVMDFHRKDNLAAKLYLNYTLHSLLALLLKTDKVWIHLVVKESTLENRN